MFDFKNNKSACLQCFYQEKPSDEVLNCESEGILGTTSNIIGSMQANEVLKTILNLKNDLSSNMLVFNSLKMSLRKVKISIDKDCINKWIYKYEKFNCIYKCNNKK